MNQFNEKEITEINKFSKYCLVNAAKLNCYDSILKNICNL